MAATSSWYVIYATFSRVYLPATLPFCLTAFVTDVRSTPRNSEAAFCDKNEHANSGQYTGFHLDCAERMRPSVGSWRGRQTFTWGAGFGFLMWFAHRAAMPKAATRLPRSTASGDFAICCNFSSCAARHSGSDHCFFKRSERARRTFSEATTPRCPAPPLVMLYVGDSSAIKFTSTVSNIFASKAEKTSANSNAAFPYSSIACARRYFGAVFECAVLMWHFHLRTAFCRVCPTYCSPVTVLVTT